MKFLFKLIIILLLPITSLAHGYWIEVQGSHKANEPVSIRLYFGEYVTGERLSGNFLDRMKDIKISVHYNGKSESITMSQQKDYWEGSYTPKAEGNYEVIGINDEREVQDWTKHNLGIVRPIQYLKTIYVVGPSQPAVKANTYLDITLSSHDSTYSITLYKDNKVYKEGKVTVTHPDGEETNLVTDAQGSAVFTISKPGLYLVGADWTDTTPGQFKGKQYATVRHKLNYTFYR